MKANCYDRVFSALGKDLEVKKSLISSLSVNEFALFSDHSVSVRSMTGKKSSN